MSSASASPCPIEELLAEDPLATTGSDNTLDQGEFVAVDSISNKTEDDTTQDDDAILVDEDTDTDEDADRCYTCHQVEYYQYHCL